MGFPSAEPCRAPQRNAATRDSARAEACYVDWRLICRTYMELGARLFLRPGTTNSDQVQVLSRQLHEPRTLGLVCSLSNTLEAPFGTPWKPLMFRRELSVVPLRLHRLQPGWEPHSNFG